MVDVYICYARKDREFALKLRERLAEHGREAWIDLRDIPPTADWWEEICTNIEASDNFLFLVSPDACTSRTCRDELAYAEGKLKRLIPVIYRPVAPRDLPPALARIQWIAFTGDAFEDAFQL